MDQRRACSIFVHVPVICQELEKTPTFVGFGRTFRLVKSLLVERPNRRFLVRPINARISASKGSRSTGKGLRYSFSRRTIWLRLLPRRESSKRIWRNTTLSAIRHCSAPVFRERTIRVARIQVRRPPKQVSPRQIGPCCRRPLRHSKLISQISGKFTGKFVTIGDHKTGRAWRSAGECGTSPYFGYAPEQGIFRTIRASGRRYRSRRFQSTSFNDQTHDAPSR